VGGRDEGMVGRRHRRADVVDRGEVGGAGVGSSEWGWCGIGSSPGPTEKR
jgi:hypothetical protein